MKSSRITRVLTTTGFALGAFALAVAAQGVWTPAPSSPPNGNVDAPINVGDNLQTKWGSLWVKKGLEVDGNLIVASGTPTTVGYVLTAVDTLGTVAWRPAGGGGGSSAGVSPVAYFYWNYDNSADRIGDSYNISSVTRNVVDPSFVTVTFQTPLTGNGYVVTCNGGTYSGESGPVWTNAYDRRTTGFKVRNFYVYSRDAGPYTVGSLSCVVYGGTDTVIYGNDNGANKIVSFGQASRYSFDTLGTSGNDIDEAIEDATGAGGAISNSITLNTANTYRVTYTYTPISGTAPNIRFVSTNVGRTSGNGSGLMTNVAGTGAVGTTDYQAVSGTHSFTFVPSATNGYLEISIGSGSATNFSMTDISLTIAN